jgi:MFS family permease
LVEAKGIQTLVSVTDPKALSPEQPGVSEEAASAPFPRAAVAWTAVGILVVLSILAFLDRQIVSLMVPAIKADFGVSDSRMGLLQGAAFSLVYAVAALPFGYAVDRYSRRVTLFIGVFCWALAATGCGLAFSFNTLLAARLGVGLGEAALNPVVASMLSDLFPKRRLATAFAVVSLGSSLGTQGALIIGGAVLYWAGDGMTVPVLGFLAPWKVAFIVTGLPGLLLAFTIFLIPEPKRRVSAAAATSQPGWSDVLPFLRKNSGLLACYIGGFSSLAIAASAMMMWAPTALQRIYGMKASTAGVVLGVFSLSCAMVGTLAAGATVDRLIARGMRDAHVVFYSMAAVVVGVAGVASVFAPAPWIYLLLLAPVKLISNFSGVAASGLQLVTPAKLRGRVTAIYGMFSVTLGATVAPSAVAFFTDVVFRDESKVHWSIATTMASFALLALVLLLLARRPLRRASAAAEA